MCLLVVLPAYRTPTPCSALYVHNLPTLLPHTFHQVDIIFDDSYSAAAFNLLDMQAFIAAYGAEAETLPAVKSGRVYAFNNKLAKNSGDTITSDFVETAFARPDLVSFGCVAMFWVCARVCSGAHLLGSGGCLAMPALTTPAVTTLPTASNTPLQHHYYRCCKTLSRSSPPPLPLLRHQHQPRG